MGMKALAFSEHGSIMEWYHKKKAIEDAGMKYVHAIEAYLTTTLSEKVRDNYHCVLIARNYNGFLELNKLISQSFNRTDNHFYYVPRISFDELFSTSDNILVTTACVGGVLGKADDYIQQKFIDFLKQNKHRCFLEIGHHIDEKQVVYNRKLLKLSEETGVPLVAGTDTHVLNEQHEKGRSILQQAKNIHFDDEDQWDLKFKSLQELIAAYQKQKSLPESVYMEAIQNTNVLADLVEDFSINKDTKYPHIYSDPEATFRKKISETIQTHPYALKNHTKEELDRVVEEEFEVYKATKSIDFMLMQTYLREWERQQGIQCGYGRGSVSGSMIAYLLGVTQMDSMRFGLNFTRFMNPSRVTNADIDTDYSGKDRDTVKQFLLRDKMNLPNINSAEIITFNTIALKGAVRDVCRALFKDKPDINYLDLSDKISKEVERNEESARKAYPEIFKFVDIVNGTIVSIGTHPSGVLISDLPINELVGLCSISTSDYPVSMLNMKELDELMYVKLDILGLDNLGVINDTCKTLGIERLTPDNTDLDDMEVWKSIRDDTTLIFQWESNSAQQYLKKFMSDSTLKIAQEKIPNFSMLKWLSFGNGLIRPACASFRDSVAEGHFYDNGFDALNEFLAPEAGRIAMQETIMRFLVKFCGYSQAESDNVRRAIAKKKGTETLLPEIEERFIDYCSKEYEMTAEECSAIIKPFIQIILDASAYGFSWNHSDAYSAVGYICGYLRYYHPLEFLTAALNIFDDDMDKTMAITSYANKVGIRVTMPKFGISKSKYEFDANKRVIAKGLASVKYLSAAAASELYDLAHSKHYLSFMELLADIDSKTTVNSRQLEILIHLDFFSDFGNQRELLRMVDVYTTLFKKGQAKQIKKAEIDGTIFEDAVKKYSTGITKSGGNAKSYTLLDVASILRECESIIRSQHLDDLDVMTKIQNVYNAMGYLGYITGDEADRRKLYITKVKSLFTQKNKEQFGYSVFTKSIGSGVESRFTVYNNVFNKIPVKEGDVIYCKDYQRKYTSRGLFFVLSDYKVIS